MATLTHPSDIAAAFGCTAAQLKTQYEANVGQLRGMLAKAEQTGKKVGGLTAAQLADRVAIVVGQLSRLA